MADYNDVLQSASDLAVLASDRADAASQIIHDVANGGETETVTTESGELNTLAKAIKDITDRIESASLAPQIEPFTITAGVLEYTLSSMNTSGVALYIEGSREFDFTVVDTDTIRLPREFPDGTRAWVVKREIYTPEQEAAVQDADTVDGLHANQFLRSDTDNAYADRFVFGVDGLTEGSVRIERDAANLRFRMVPADPVSDWDFADLFGYEAGRWFFHNAPLVDNGNEIYHQGNDGVGSGLDAEFFQGLDTTSFGKVASTNTWEGAQIYTDSTTGEAAGVVRLNFNGTRFSMAPHDGTGWDYNNELGFEAGSWYFDSKPLINGQLPVIEGEAANVPAVFTEGIATTTDLDCSSATSFIVDNSAAVTLNLINDPSDKAFTVTVLAEGNAGIDWSTNNTINWTDNTEPTQGATWTLYVLTHVPTRGWYGSLGGRA